MALHAHHEWNCFVGSILWAIVCSKSVVMLCLNWIEINKWRIWLNEMWITYSFKFSWLKLKPNWGRGAASAVINAIATIWNGKIMHIQGAFNQGVPWICWSFFTGIFLLGGSHLWTYLVNMDTSIIWCDSNIKVQYFSVWLWYTLCSPLMAYHHNDRLCEKVLWLLPNHIPIKLLFLFCTQLN